MEQKNIDIFRAYAEAGMPGAMSYEEYRALIDSELAQGRVTGNEQSENLIEYTKLNIVRMNRWDKHTVLTQELKAKMSEVSRPTTWLVITEGWCGDSAQILPVLEKIASLNTLVELKIVLRDENDHLMEAALTDGKRAIPKLIALDEMHQVIWTWGPRPAGAMKIMQEGAAAGLSAAEKKEKLHLWYASDRALDIQKELIALIP